MRRMKTTKSSAVATSRTVASHGSRSGAWIAYVAILWTTSEEELAWIVDRDPSLPWVIALSMVTTSSPRTSPTITRDGFIRSVSRTSSAIVTAPAPSVLGSRSSKATALGWCSMSSSSPSSSERSTVRIRSSDPISDASARSNVVFPALVAPATITFLRARTSAGKTTLLRALASEIGSEERILTVERSLELGLDEDIEHHPNAVAFEERLPNTEGAGAVTIAELVRDTLRMNPSRVIVGEVLGDEVVTMLNAMTQGNDGSLSTIHANSSSDVVHKIATYAIQAPERLPWEATVRLVATALDFVVFIRRIRGEEGQRRVMESIREIAGISDDGQLQTNELWGPDPLGNVVRRHGVQVRAQDDLMAVGWRPNSGGWS